MTGGHAPDAGGIARPAPMDGQVARFATALAACGVGIGPLGVAVSGGGDSLALLLLAHAALPGRIAAATVDHGLRAEAAQEALFVARLCAARGIPHDTLHVTPAGRAGPQGNARAARYRALAGWAADRGLPAVATAHHADDQAETLLLRLARGAGLAGLAGARTMRPLGPGVALVRPLIDWRRAELAGIVTACGIAAVNDPSNADPRYDRTHARALLATAGWLDPARLAASAGHLAAAEAALAWAADRAWQDRAAPGADGGMMLDPAGLPDEIVRRLLVRALCHTVPADPPDGPALARFTAALAAGQVATLAGVRAAPAPDGRWHLAPAPPRRTG